MTARSTSCERLWKVRLPRRLDRGGYDLVCFFDAPHDIGDPVGAAIHIRQSLADDAA